MPPKKKNKKNKKPSSALDALQTQEESKDQLWEKALGLQEELQSVRKEKSFFKLEKDKIQEIWETSKKNLEESELLLKSKIRAKAKYEERHRVEITVYKQKLKHVLSEQHNGVFEVRTGAVSSSSLVQNQNTEAELELCRDIQNLQADNREKKLQEHSSIKQLKLNQQAELMKLSYEHEVRMQEMEEQKLWTIQSVAEAQQKKQVKAMVDIETRMKHLSTLLMTEHQRKLKKIEGTFDEFREATENRFFFCKEDMKKLQKEEVKWDRNMSAAQQENQRLKETLQEVQQQIPELQRQLQECRLSKDSVERSRAQKKLVEKELRDLTVEHELLLQAFQKVQQERDELLKRQRESLLDVQQRSGLKKMLLQKKLAALTEALEKKEAQLSAALSVCSSEPTARSNAATKLEEILESKRVSLEALQEDLAQENQQLKASGPVQPDQ
ncbi:dynein regulatory complex subunit 4 isoform X2 [Fundulus heteroclitus]|uniref:dynein regulatory complex subunit 4 isoform X2 n=1 Tax=Fundulus heteroclitus TaxID=8078 RepID=UPI00165A30BB|nr:dynein regulatory complex subunit 4 isoform X2 [Fundulus heteroclitus]